MEERLIKIYPKHGARMYLKMIPGHFVTSHSHINAYFDMTTLKTRQADAAMVAGYLQSCYVTTTIVDTIICVEGTQVIGAILAEKLTQAGFMSLNSHKSIYVITPEEITSNQIILRDNLKPMVQHKNVMILCASITTGKTARKAKDMVMYYGGTVTGIASIFSSCDTVDGMKVESIFKKSDLPEYRTYSVPECPMCKQRVPIDAIVNGYGYSKL